MAEHIEPCPFGCKAGLTVYQSLDCEYVICDRCESTGPAAKTREAAIAAWNKRAAPAHTVPEGFALVPVEPTPEMVKAGANSGGLGMEFHEWMGRVTIAWRHMLAAAPQDRGGEP